MRDVFDSGSYRLPDSSVTFTTTDAALQAVYDDCEALCLKNRKTINDYNVLVEGAKYIGVWLETQPLGGEMYAKRDMRAALDNILIFLRYQRRDGRYPGMISDGGVWRGIICHYDWMQGCFLPYPALKLYYLLGRDEAYLRALYDSLADFDTYLWRYRDSDGDGCLESFCIWDTGEDNCTKHILSGITSPQHGGWGRSVPPENYGNMPYESAEYMSYSYACRSVLAIAADLLGDGRAEEWRDKARAVREKFCAYLWDDERKTCFDRDRDNQPIPTLSGAENIKCLYSGIYTQQMADDFIGRHLLCREEFWTPYPLPSFAANDRFFHVNATCSNCAAALHERLGDHLGDMDDNSWSGPIQGLTYQRSIEAMLRYGHHTEGVMIGERFLQLLGEQRRYVQQYNPFTGETAAKAENGYGPTMLSALEFISLSRGVNITYDFIDWSSLPGTDRSVYTQRFAGHTYTLTCDGALMRAEMDGREIFRAGAGARVRTDMTGDITAVFGILPEATAFSLQYRGCAMHAMLEPNAEFRPAGGKLCQAARIPFAGIT